MRECVEQWVLLRGPTARKALNGLLLPALRRNTDAAPMLGYEVRKGFGAPFDLLVAASGDLVAWCGTEQLDIGRRLALDLSNAVSILRAQGWGVDK